MNLIKFIIFTVFVMLLFASPLKTANAQNYCDGGGQPYYFCNVDWTTFHSGSKWFTYDVFWELPLFCFDDSEWYTFDVYMPTVYTGIEWWRPVQTQCVATQGENHPGLAWGFPDCVLSWNTYFENFDTCPDDFIKMARICLRGYILVGAHSGQNPSYNCINHEDYGWLEIFNNQGNYIPPPSDIPDEPDGSHIVYFIWGECDCP